MYYVSVLTSAPISANDLRAKLKANDIVLDEIIDLEDDYITANVSFNDAVVSSLEEEGFISIMIDEDFIVECELA